VSKARSWASCSRATENDRTSNAANRSTTLQTRPRYADTRQRFVMVGRCTHGTSTTLVRMCLALARLPLLLQSLSTSHPRHTSIAVQRSDRSDSSKLIRLTSHAHRCRLECNRTEPPHDLSRTPLLATPMAAAPSSAIDRTPAASTHTRWLAYDSIVEDATNVELEPGNTKHHAVRWTDQHLAITSPCAWRAFHSAGLAQKVDHHSTTVDSTIQSGFAASTLPQRTLTFAALQQEDLPPMEVSRTGSQRMLVAF
jgi:hypothetical protein